MTDPGRPNLHACSLRSIWLHLGLGIICVLLVSGEVQAVELPAARQLYSSGQYRACVEAATTRMQDDYYGEDWPLLKIQSQLQLGKYAGALDTLEAALKQFPRGVRIRWLGHRVMLLNNRTDRADVLLTEISELATHATYRYDDSANRVALGEYYLYRGADPRRVLETFYDPVKKEQPQFPDAYIAAGQLALSKSDFALAVEEFSNALKRQEDNPDIHLGLARAFASSDAKQANAHLQAALKINPRHIESLLMIVDNHVDAELYDEAEKVLQKVLDVNPHESQAWAYRAVLAHLRGDEVEEREARDKALASWSQNPQVDYLIGRKLSQKYRFAEGAEYQRRAIAFDKFFMPAQLQLAQDLLRLGKEEEGWQRAEMVFDADQYNVVAHNLVQLEANLAKFHTLQNDDFTLRMDATESAIYGQHMLGLLGRAKQTLCQKYGMVISEPVTVEIFPQQQDFAIRTFGLPGGDGFLGVCFGHVITANSPASQGQNPANLESVLWHEFCHVVTLQKTRNRMPRWLSEGISVYEERVANRSWGQAMDLLSRNMILGGQLTPVSRLSGAFLDPPSAAHLQFAYFESSLVVQYLVEQHGQETLNQILTQLGTGTPINDALEQYTGSIDKLDQQFEQYARQQAEQLAPDATWEPFELPPSATIDDVTQWLTDHPRNFDALRRYGHLLAQQQRWDDVKKIADRLLQIYPSYVGSDNSYELLAAASRAEKDTAQEREVLERWATLQSDATSVYLRLMQLAADDQDWQAVARNADRMLAVNPLVPTPHRFRALAAEQLNDDQAAVESYRALLEMDPADPAELHYQLAKHLQQSGIQDAALRQVLMALDEAPRYRDAHRLLLKIVASKDTEQGAIKAALHKEPSPDSEASAHKQPAAEATAPATPETAKGASP